MIYAVECSFDNMVVLRWKTSPTVQFPGDAALIHDSILMLGDMNRNIYYHYYYVITVLLIIKRTQP